MVMIGRVLKGTSSLLIYAWKRAQVQRRKKVVTRVKMVTSPDDFIHRPNVIRSTEECVDSFLVAPMAGDNYRAQNSDDSIYRLLVTSCQHPQLLSLLFLSFNLCLSPKNGKHMSVPRISPAFFGSQVTATVTMSHYLLRPVTAGTNLGLFFPYACLSHLIVPHLRINC